MSTEFVNFTGVSCQKFKCSARGLILPFGIEACMSIQLRAVLYFIFLLYLFLGIAIIADIFMSSIETITSKTRKIRYPDPGEKDKYIIVDVRLWNDTVANLTLMALGSSSPEILLSIIEIVGNRFEAGELGPGTIVGSAAYNLLMICAICIAAIKTPDTKRIKLYNVFMVTSFFGFFAYIWMFIVLSVISKDVVDLWEAVITFLMFPLVVILAFLAEKNFFVSSEVLMEDEEKALILTPPELDQTGTARGFRKDELLQFLRDLGQSTNLSLEEKAQLFAAKLSESMHRSRMQYRIQGSRMLTGGKSLFVNLPDKLHEIYQRAVKPQSLDGAIAADHQLDGRKGTLSRLDVDDDPQMAILEFASSSYAVLEREQRVTVEVVRHGFTNSVIRFR
jgi:solute carrier family 8 (sodium/calcium exchanger)